MYQRTLNSRANSDRMQHHRRRPSGHLRALYCTLLVTPRPPRPSGRIRCPGLHHEPNRGDPSRGCQPQLRARPIVLPVFAQSMHRRPPDELYDHRRRHRGRGRHRRRGARHQRREHPPHRPRDHALRTRGRRRDSWVRRRRDDGRLAAEPARAFRSRAVDRRRTARRDVVGQRQTIRSGQGVLAEFDYVYSDRATPLSRTGADPSGNCVKRDSEEGSDT